MSLTALFLATMISASSPVGLPMPKAKALKPAPAETWAFEWIEPRKERAKAKRPLPVPPHVVRKAKALIGSPVDVKCLFKGRDGSYVFSATKARYQYRSLILHGDVATWVDGRIQPYLDRKNYCYETTADGKTWKAFRIRDGRKQSLGEGRPIWITDTTSLSSLNQGFVALQFGYPKQTAELTVHSNRGTYTIPEALLCGQTPEGDVVVSVGSPDQRVVEVLFLRGDRVNSRFLLPKGYALVQQTSGGRFIAAKIAGQNSMSIESAFPLALLDYHGRWAQLRYDHGDLSRVRDRLPVNGGSGFELSGRSLLFICAGHWAKLTPP